MENLLAVRFSVHISVKRILRTSQGRIELREDFVKAQNWDMSKKGMMLVGLGNLTYLIWRLCQVIQFAFIKFKIYFLKYI